MTLLDTTRGIETPEGIELRLPLAGPMVRVLAWSIDSTIRIGVYVLLGLLLSWIEGLGSGVFFILLFVVEWFYPVLFEVRRDGMTPGKKMLGIRVVHDDGTPIGWSASVVRNLLRFVDALPLFYVTGIVSMVVHPEFRRLGDLVAGSVVVYADQPQAGGELPTAAPQPPRQPLLADEAQAVVAFAERAERLGDERANELASRTGPLVAGDAEPARTLLGIANWVAGR